LLVAILEQLADIVFGFLEVFGGIFGLGKTTDHLIAIDYTDGGLDLRIGALSYHLHQSQAGKYGKGLLNFKHLLSKEN